MSWSEMTGMDRFDWLWSIQSSFLGLMLAKYLAVQFRNEDLVDRELGKIVCSV